MHGGDAPVESPIDQQADKDKPESYEYSEE